MRKIALVLIGCLIAGSTYAVDAEEEAAKREILSKLAALNGYITCANSFEGRLTTLKDLQAAGVALSGQFNLLAGAVNDLRACNANAAALIR